MEHDLEVIIYNLVDRFCFIPTISKIIIIRMKSFEKKKLKKPKAAHILL